MPVHPGKAYDPFYVGEKGTFLPIGRLSSAFLMLLV